MVDRTIRRGDVVKDIDGWEGVVVDVQPNTDDWHGSISVWQRNREEYGTDNCEHYCYDSWQEVLQILDE